VDHLYAAPVLLKYLREEEMGDITVVSPDVGGLKMSYAYAKALGAGLAIVAKHRVSATEVEAINVIGEVKGRDCLIVDDLTETAGTLQAAAEVIMSRGANSVRAGVSHAVLGDLGRQRLVNSPIIELITTDSTPQARGEKVVTLGVASLLGEGIKRIHYGESVTSLFDISE
jgi:ribose-phosphate pyrophosphokinase